MVAAVIGWAVVMGTQYSGPFLGQMLEIQKVTVEGIYRIDKQEVVDLIRLKPGTPLHHVVLSGVKARVETHPWVKEATVSRVPFHELHVSVIERTPMAVVRAGSQNFLSDGEGYVLAPLAQKDDISLPLVTGVDLKGLEGNEVQIHYQGACGDCPSSLTGTLQHIDRLIKQQLDADLTVKSV